jgi:3,4-dihydroxy 2-butanone 4-phosphate synthase/GTP cyclohydrolase II
MFATVEEALTEIAAGRMIVVVDDEDRENEGDLTMAAEFATPEAINFMAKFGRGLICLTLTEERADYLRLGPMATENTSRFGTAFTESIEAREGVTTGISAADRAHTIRVAVDPQSTAADLARPGHVFPLRARKGGVLVRAGQTEAGCDLARMAGLTPAGIICEIMNDDGSMARVPDLLAFCEQHGVKMLTVAELIRYRLQHERYVRRAGEGVLQTQFGEFRVIAYENEVDGGESHVALVYGEIGGAAGHEDRGTSGPARRRGAGLAEAQVVAAPAADQEPVLVRVQARNLAGDVFGASGSDARAMIDGSLERIAREGRGVLVYLHNGSVGFGLDRSLTPTRLLLQPQQRGRGRRDDGSQTLREVGVGGQILSDLGLRRIRLLTNTPTHVPALHGFGIEIVEHVPVPLAAHR